MAGTYRTSSTLVSHILVHRPVKVLIYSDKLSFISSSRLISTSKSTNLSLQFRSSLHPSVRLISCASCSPPLQSPFHHIQGFISTWKGTFFKRTNEHFIYVRHSSSRLLFHFVPLVPSSTRSTTVQTPFAICLPRYNRPELHSAHSSLPISSPSHSSTRGCSGTGAWKIKRTAPPDARVNPCFSESSNRQLILHGSPTKHGCRFRYGTSWERGPASRFAKTVARRFKTASNERQAVVYCKK